MAMVQAPHGKREKPVVNVKSDHPTEITPANNVGGVILRDRSETPHNARFFVSPMEEGFDRLISALMIEEKLPMSVG